MEAGVSGFFYYESKFKIKEKNLGGGGGGARVSDFFTKNPNLKGKNFFFFGVGYMDGQTNRPKPICPFNCFDIGGITMNKCTRYGPD